MTGQEGHVRGGGGGAYVVRLLVSLPVLWSCVAVEGNGPLEARRQAIYGGQPASLDTAVYFLAGSYDNGGKSECSAVLIGPQTLLTAAHCVDPAVKGATSVQLVAQNSQHVEGPGSGSGASSGSEVAVSEVRRHPRWRPEESLSHDLALLLLEHPQEVPPRVWNPHPVSGFTGKPLRAVGYGKTESGGTGERRQVELTFRHVETDHLYLGDAAGQGICQGDSGGPSFHTFPDGVERVVGIHSFTLSLACVDGADVRVDRYGDFISQWLREKEPPQCARDGRCVEGCPGEDPDCACLGDGACDVRCQPLWEDPDCPKECGPDGVCAQGRCPGPDPDPDCLADGEPCLRDNQCAGQRCIPDADGRVYTCSHGCRGAADCQDGQRCDEVLGACRSTAGRKAAVGEPCSSGITLCPTGTACTGPVDGQAHCQPVCQVHADCGSVAGPGACVPGQGGLGYCVMGEPRPQFYPRAGAEPLPSASGCEAGRGGTGWLAALLPLVLLAASRSQRRERRD